MRINNVRWQRADEVDVVEVLTELGYSLSNGKMSCPRWVTGDWSQLPTAAILGPKYSAHK